MVENKSSTFRHLLNQLFFYPAKAWYAFRAGYRHARITKPLSRILGPQYRRSRDRIEIDLTYACNLRCLNCNRSVSQAPEKLYMSRERIKQFIAESIARQKHWKNIRLLGGEPTLHPEFLGILDDLLQYRKSVPHCVIEVVTNGNGKAVKAMLKKIPAGIVIENSAKSGNLQPTFGPFNLAPVDTPAYRFADYRNGCAVMEECGMALTPLGYYPCAVAGGIDRIEGNQLGHDSIPADDDDMLAAAEKLCRLCGHFREGHFIPNHLRPLTMEQKTSPTWVRLYDKWRKEKPLRRQRDAHENPHEVGLRFQEKHTVHSSIIVRQEATKV